MSEGEVNVDEQVEGQEEIVVQFDENIPEDGFEVELGEQEEDENSQFKEGALLGEDELDDDDSESSSELGSEEIDEEEDLEEEERRRKRKKDKKKKKKKIDDEEEEVEEEELVGAVEGEEVAEEEVIGDEYEYRQRMESMRPMSIKAVISGFDLDMGDDEGEEEVTESTESEPTPLIREPYYAIYLKHMKTYAAARRLNNFLHKKMSEYFKKRKMEHVLREMAEHIDEAKTKYGMKLDSFQDLITYDKNQRAKVHMELKQMKKMRKEQLEKAEQAFNDFITLERNTGIGLINSKTGKEISDKVVDKLLNNQRNKAKEVKNLRLKHIKIRNAVADKHAAIRALDRIGENYTLIEFEQMNIENAAHIDKVEEKDDELSKLRKKCSGAIQCLAHIREKCYAVEISIRSMKFKLEKKDIERIESRELMNELKQKRDYFRHETLRLKNVHGLLAKDKLLIDMENAMKETEEIQVDIERRKKIYDRKRNKLTILKENYGKEKKRRSEERSEDSKGSKSTVSSMEAKPKQLPSRGRPTIMMAVFPEFEH